MIEGLFHLPTRLKQPYGYKFRDRARCQHCGMLQPKSQTEPDYLAAIVWSFVEVKGAHDRWNWNTGEPISEVQRRRLEETKGWIFLELGEGRRPKGKQAFLIPYSAWVPWQNYYDNQNIKSITLEGTARLPSARTDLKMWALDWKDGRWTVPSKSPFWVFLEDGLRKLMSYIKEIRDEQQQEC